jgi:6,7-dimethyl-8-ribityllumazine synthase
MSADSPNFQKLDASGLNFAILVARFNGVITEKLLAGAREAFSKCGAKGQEVFYVPGAFELPFAAKKLAGRGGFDAIVALGAVIRGETPHFDFVAGQAAAGIMQASMDTGIPVMFGVVTADTQEQAEARCGGAVGNKGFEAAMSAIEMANLSREMEGLDQGEDKVFPHVV